jgi:predicted GIY-YIG superfamily endonuclease
MATIFKYNGVQYLSIKDACQQLGKNYAAVLKRLQANWTVAQAFDDEPRPPRHPLSLNGVTYNGVGEAVRLLNAPVSRRTAMRRMEAGMTLEESLFTPLTLAHSNGVVYSITNLVNGKQYIGITTTSLEERWQSHLDTPLKKRHLLHQSITEFGKENFAIEVLERASSLKELRVKEQEWIQKLNTRQPNGYNITKGGEMGGSAGKPTILPGDPTLYPTVRAAAKALAQREGINEAAAERRIYVERIEVKKPHGMSKSKIYRYWDNLINSTTNPRSRGYNGSTLCDRWRDFRNFHEDMGEQYQEGMILRLKDSTKPYSKDNCSWVWRYGKSIV